MVCSLAALFVAEQFAGAANFQIVRRQRKAGAEVFGHHDRFQSFFGIDAEACAGSGVNKYA